MPKITGAHLLMQCLKREGIRVIFTLVGDTILPLCDAAEDEGIQFIDTRHEGAAMAMADGWARVTGEPAVALVTGGPGFSNAMSVLPNIFTSESPVIFLAGCSELPELGMLAFQEIDQVSMAAPVTKGSWMIQHPSRIPDMIATAFRTALSGRTGPVHLTIPLDIQESEITNDTLLEDTNAEYRHHGRNPGDPKLIDTALELLRGAEKPVMIAANAARYQLSQSSMEGLMETTGLPLFTIEQARGIVSDDHPLCLGYGDASLNQAASYFREADTILLLGKRLDHRYKYGLSPFFNSEAKIIQIDPSAHEIGRNRGVSLGIMGHLGAIVDQMNEKAQSLQWKRERAWVETLLEAKRNHIRNLESKATNEEPLHAMSVYKTIKQCIPDDAILVFDGGDFVQWGRGYLKAHHPGHWLRLGPLAHLGLGLPFAISAKLAKPKSDVFLFTGDGSIGFHTMEYDTAIRHGLPFTAILGNDSVWGIDRNFQLAYYGRAVATDLRTVRYDQVVKAIGGYGEHITQTSQITAAVKRAMESEQPSLIDISIASNQSPLADAMIARRLSSRNQSQQV